MAFWKILKEKKANRLFNLTALLAPWRALHSKKTVGIGENQTTPFKWGLNKIVSVLSKTFYKYWWFWSCEEKYKDKY